MNIRISIKTYKRKLMLVNLLSEIDKYFSNYTHRVSIVLHDDCSGYPVKLVESIKQKALYYHYAPNKGKKLHWEIWDNDLRYCENCNDTDLFIFIPDDVSSINFGEIIHSAEKLKNNEYFYNIINDGRTMSWNQLPPQLEDDKIKIFFTDCAFFTNYKTLKRIGFYINSIDEKRFRRPNISSGVGQQLTNRLNASKIDIFHPYESLAYHGNHDSLMNTEERKRNPLVSISKFKPSKPIVIGIATFRGREKALKLCIDSLNNQTVPYTRLYVYDNEMNENLTDNGKFHALLLDETKDCYYFSCDDDLIYPPTYINDMIQAIEKHKCIVTHHGRKLRGINRDYYRGHYSFRCLTRNVREMEIDVAGTGVTAFSTEYFNPREIIFDKRHRMSDCLFSLLAAKQGKRIMILKHLFGYIKATKVDETTSCYGIENKNCILQNEIADEIFKIKNKLC